MKRLTQQEFIAKAISIHGNICDFSKVVYVNCRTRICLLCPNCGKEFWKLPNDYLNGKPYCPSCSMKQNGLNQIGIPKHKEKFVLGHGINDVNICAKNTIAYSIWHSILQRTIDGKYKEKDNCYKNCSIVDEWLVFSNFKLWFDKHYVEGFNIDKDLLGGKIYSPDNCVFLPSEINSFLAVKANTRDLPIGIKSHNSRFIATCGEKYLGIFDSLQDAKNAYIQEKKRRLFELANKWKNKLEKRAFDALVNLDIVKHFKLH